MINNQNDKIGALRISIYAKDVQMLTGKSERYARKIISQARHHYGKEKKHLLTVKEFANYMGINEEEVKKAIILYRG